MAKTMANICRLCGNNEDNTISIYGRKAMKHHIDLKIRVGLDIKIFPKDPLPKHVCVGCRHKLDVVWNFQNHCKSVQTHLLGLVSKRVPYQSQNINCGQHQNSKTNTEESYAHCKVLETLRDSTDNDINNPGDLCLIDTDLSVATQNGTSVATGQLDSYCQDKEENMVISAAEYTSETAQEDNPVTVEGEAEVQNNLVCEGADATNTIMGHCGTALSVNNTGVNSYLVNDRSQNSFFMEGHKLADATNTLLECCGTALSINNNSASSYLFNNRSQDSFLMEGQSLADATNTILGWCETALSVNFDGVNSCLFNDRSQDSLLMEGEILVVPNTDLSTTSTTTAVGLATGDKSCKDIPSVNNDLNQNTLHAPNIISQSSNYLATTNKSHHESKSTDTCGYINNMSQSSLLLEDQPSKSRNDLIHDAQYMSTELVNTITSNEKEVACHSVMNSLRHPLLEEEMSCKTTGPSTETCSQNVSVYVIANGEVILAFAFDSSQQLVNITDLIRKHPNHIESGTTNVSSGIESSHNESSSDDHPLFSLPSLHEPTSAVTGRVTKNAEFDLNVVSTSGDSEPLQVMHPVAETTVIQNQNMEISRKVCDLKDPVAVTSENEVHQTVLLNTASCSNASTRNEGGEHSMIVNSGSSATCAHGIDASMCIYKQCCDSHLLDKCWNKVGSCFQCSICEFVTDCTDKIRRHINAHVSMNDFKCAVCHKKYRSYQSLSSHIKCHSRTVDGSSSNINAHVSMNDFECAVCHKKYQSLSSHIKCHSRTVDGSSSNINAHVSMNDFECAVCHKKYPSYQSLSSHIKCHSRTADGRSSNINAHVSMNDFKCAVCHKKYPSYQTLSSHIKCHSRTADGSSSNINAHVSMNDFKCAVCHKKYPSYQSLSSHIKCHSRTVDGSSSRVRGVYSCEKCSTNFRFKNSLLIHQAKKCVSCPDCGMCFSSVAKHKRSCAGETGFVCHWCNRSYKFKQQLRDHLPTHDRGEFACDKCDNIYRVSYFLRRHQNAEHGTGKFKCTHCKKTFDDKFNLNKHIISNIKVRQYVCEICRNRFRTSGNLAKHMKFHGKKNVKCHLCGEMYFHKTLLQYHMKKVHCK